MLPQRGTKSRPRLDTRSADTYTPSFWR
jgi:hypothetical protein